MRPRPAGPLELVAVAGELSRSHRVLAGTVAAAYGVRPVLRHDGPDGAAAAVAAASGDRLVLVRPGVVPDAVAALRLAAVLDDSESWLHSRCWSTGPTWS